MRTILKEIKRVTVPGRCIGINVTDYGYKGTKYPIPADTIVLGRKIGLDYEDNIIWVKNVEMMTSPARKRAGNFYKWKNTIYFKPDNVYECIIIFRKGKMNYDNYREEIKKYKMDLTPKEMPKYFKKFTKDIWEIKPAVHTKDVHPLAFPIELPMAAIFFYTLPGETVLDPFAGSAVTGKAALKLGRKFIGYELRPFDKFEYVKFDGEETKSSTTCYELIANNLRVKDRRLTEFL